MTWRDLIRRVTPPKPSRPNIPESLMAERPLTHCPETGRDLAGVDIRAHCENLWPGHTPPLMMSKEALERRALLLAEAERRERAPKTDR